MPLELLKKPKVGKGPTTNNKPQEPSLLRDIFEGVVDTGLGAIGVGPDSKSNRIGALLGMALPLGKLGRYDTKLNARDFPSQNRLAMGGSPGSNAIYDASGRYLGPSNTVDSVYQAHLGSSVGKHKLSTPQVKLSDGYEKALGRLGGKSNSKLDSKSGGRLRVQNMEEAFLEKGMFDSTTTEEQLKSLIRKHSGKDK